MRKQGGLARPRTLRFPTSVRNKKLVWHCYPIIKTPVDQLFNWINFHVKSAADAMRGHITKYWPNNIIQIQNFPLFIGSRCKISPILLGQNIKFPLFVGSKSKISPFLSGQNSKFTPLYWVKIQNATCAFAISSKIKIKNCSVTEGPYVCSWHRKQAIVRWPR